MQQLIRQTIENPTILYVEDNPDNQKLVTRILQAEGYNVFGAANAPEGFKILEHETPDIILMDIHLPGIDGYTMTKQLREQKGLNKIPIVALTANVTSNDEQKSILAGCSGLIHKPIDVDELPNQVRFYMQHANE